jgi:hypothetical protein
VASTQADLLVASLALKRVLPSRGAHNISITTMASRPANDGQQILSVIIFKVKPMIFIGKGRYNGRRQGYGADGAAQRCRTER